MLRRQLLRQGRTLSHTSIQKPIVRSSPFSRHLHSQTIPLRPATALPPRLHCRWQTTEAAQKTENQSAPATETTSEAAKEDPAKKELEQKNREIIDLKDKYLRSVADYRNLQDRTKRDMDSARQFAIQRFATDLLDSIDNLDRALDSVSEDSLNPDSDSSSSDATTSTTSSADPNLAAASESSTDGASGIQRDLFNLHAGLKMTESILMSTLKKHGLERFDPMEGEGRKFDPRLDEATFFTKVEGKQDGDVFHTQSKGFTLNGRIIRAAKVGVVKNS